MTVSMTDSIAWELSAVKIQSWLYIPNDGYEQVALNYILSLKPVLGH